MIPMHKPECKEKESNNAEAIEINSETKQEKEDVKKQKSGIIAKCDVWPQSIVVSHLAKGACFKRKEGEGYFRHTEMLLVNQINT